jgi:hypothetical protein
VNGPENLLIIYPEAGLAQNSLLLQTYTTSSLLTRLHAVPCRKDYFSTFFSSVSAFTSSSRCKRSKPSNARDCRRFALRLHGATHLSLADMQLLCKRSGVWTPARDQSLFNAFYICSSCQMTGRPHTIRKISTSYFSRTFNSHIQVDFFYVEDLDPLPILQIRDTSTSGIPFPVGYLHRPLHVVSKLLAIWTLPAATSNYTGSNSMDLYLNAVEILNLIMLLS